MVDRLNIQIRKLFTLTGHKDSVYSLERYINGNFCSAGSDGGVLQWDTADPEKAILITQLEGSVYCMHIIGEEFLAVGENNFGVRILDLKERREIAFLPLPKKQIFNISSHGDKIYIADGAGAVHVIEMVTWKTIKILQLSNKRARAIALDAERGEMAIGYSDQYIRVVSMTDYRLLHEWRAHEKSVFCLVWLPGSEWLLSSSMDARLRLWHGNKDFAPGGEIVAHTFAINYIDISPNGKYFLTCSMDKTIKLWDLKEGALLKVIDQARYESHSASVNIVKWINEDTFVSGGDDKKVNIWKIDGI